MEPITVKALTAQWLEDHRITNANTANGYQNLIFHHIIPGIGTVPLCELTTECVQQFYGSLTQVGLSAQSVRCVHLLLRRCLDEACRENLLDRNPAAPCLVPQSNPREVERLRLGQLQRYLNAAEAAGTLPLLYVGLTSGLRQCELLTLPWAAFDARNGWILQGKRLLMMNEKAAKLLVEEHQRHPEHSSAFPNPKTDQPYQRHELYYLHRKILRQAHLPQIPFRDLAQLCREAGL